MNNAGKFMCKIHMSWPLLYFQTLLIQMCLYLDCQLMCKMTSGCYFYSYGAKGGDHHCWFHQQYGWTMKAHDYAVSGDQD